MSGAGLGHSNGTSAMAVCGPRYGGEELAVNLENSNRTTALGLIERLRVGVGEIGLQHEGVVPVCSRSAPDWR